MALRNPDTLDGDAHGIRPWDYWVEFSTSGDPRIFASDEAPALRRLAEVSSVDVGYGVGPYGARLQMWDVDAVQTVGGLGSDQQMLPPQIGDQIRIWVKAGDDPTLLFRGTVQRLQERREESTVSYSVQAVSNIARLNESHVTLTANLISDPLRPTPLFDQGGRMVENRRRSLAELVDLVLRFPNAFGQTGHFRPEDIDWGSLRNDPRCGGFVPSNISFDATPKGQAIESLLEQAGNFTFVYDPERDKVALVELNRLANRCGPQWEIRFPQPGIDELIDAERYAHEVDVLEDHTEWDSSRVANACRIIGGPIRWYSGHYAISQLHADDGPPLLQDIGQDTVAQQQQRSRNFEQVPYRFDLGSWQEDYRFSHHCWVGVAMFPDWNVLEDFLPAIVTADKIVPHADWFDAEGEPTAACPTVRGIKPATRELARTLFRGEGEFQSRTIGDVALAGGPTLKNHNNLRVYQAWESDGPCPACGGSGAVSAIYTGEDNEPDIEWVEVSGRWTYRVTNYRFDPTRFGTINPDTGELYPPEGLSPWAGGGYPVAHKHLCPYCRGVGLRPAYKIRNVQDSLMQGRNQKASLSQESDYDDPISLDPDALQTGPESWAESQTRITIEQGPIVMQESQGHLNLPSDTALVNQATWTWTEGAGGPARFPHPLALVHVGQHFGELTGYGFAPLVDLNATAQLPPTTVEAGSSNPYRSEWSMGRILFEHPIFIGAEYQQWPLRTSERDCYLVTRHGLIRRGTEAGGKTTVDNDGTPTGFWRPARVWLQCLYEKQGLYDTLESHRPRTIKAVTDEGDTERYSIHAAIVDGRYALDVIKLDPDQDPESLELSSLGRLVELTVADLGATLEIHPDDFDLDPTPPAADLDDEAYRQYKIDQAYRFPEGRTVLWQGYSPGEELLAEAGALNPGYFSSVTRPKNYLWRLRDDRSKLLGQAIRQLEAQNNIQISGSLSVLNMVRSPGAGLGWINYPERGRATVRRVTYRLDSGLIAELELTREQARYGQLPKDQSDRLNQIEQSLAEMQTASATRSRGAGRSPSGIGSATVPQNNGW